ncbi:uncharacterized protein PFL1_02160 [Pseudozyma flocculosa PF-1]|uniref:C3H1-type domain-containing protein n=1 Tax=Pseudozyma flocculosa TaxID=84751 RepID=A0A5C3FB74_9BASI|nr:uncharacterized protein PFL1_02160 [Pseudozyma flocculosa PF-1]EPQ30043.1 hypothetical protein PFL1_02160 [Pseudozyma flocculosa PF-1]SPO41376.1 uncharacterized protein PSFLO_06858 [Pseudozyma flocculosa]
MLPLIKYFTGQGDDTGTMASPSDNGSPMDRPLDIRGRPFRYETPTPAFRRRRSRSPVATKRHYDETPRHDRHDYQHSGQEGRVMTPGRSDYGRDNNDNDDTPCRHVDLPYGHMNSPGAASCRTDRTDVAIWGIQKRLDQQEAGQATLASKIDRQSAALDMILTRLDAQPATTAPPQQLDGNGAISTAIARYTWVPRDVVEAIADNRFIPEQLAILVNPAYRPQHHPARNDQGERADEPLFQALSCIGALCDSWSTYVGIVLLVGSREQPDLAPGLLAHLEHIIVFSSLYEWRGVVGYHLAVCRRRLGTASGAEWAAIDADFSNTHLRPIDPRSNNNNPAQRDAQRARPKVCKNFNLNRCAGQRCGRSHKCLACNGRHPVFRCHGLRLEDA